MCPICLLGVLGCPWVFRAHVSDRCLVAGSCALARQLTFSCPPVASHPPAASLLSSCALPSCALPSTCHPPTLLPTHHPPTLPSNRRRSPPGYNASGRLNDFYLLHADGGSTGKLAWQDWTSVVAAAAASSGTAGGGGAAAGSMPSMRGAHVAEVVGGSVYILGGTAGKTKDCVEDGWRIDIAPGELSCGAAGQGCSLPGLPAAKAAHCQCCAARQAHGMGIP